MVQQPVAYLHLPTEAVKAKGHLAAVERALAELLVLCLQGSKAGQENRDRGGSVREDRC